MGMKVKTQSFTCEFEVIILESLLAQSEVVDLRVQCLDLAVVIQDHLLVLLCEGVVLVLLLQCLQVPQSFLEGFVQSRDLVLRHGDVVAQLVRLGVGLLVSALHWRARCAWILLLSASSSNSGGGVSAGGDGALAWAAGRTVVMREGWVRVAVCVRVAGGATRLIA